MTPVLPEKKTPARASSSERAECVCVPQPMKTKGDADFVHRISDCRQRIQVIACDPYTP